MTRPTSLLIAGQTFAVEWVGQDDTMGKRSHEPHGDLGLTSPASQRIAIREGQGFESERDTVLHESIHAVLALTSNDRFGDDGDREALVNAVSVGILATLRHNPGLADYLTEQA